MGHHGGRVGQLAYGHHGCPSQAVRSAVCILRCRGWEGSSRETGQAHDYSVVVSYKAQDVTQAGWCPRELEDYGKAYFAYLLKWEV